MFTNVTYLAVASTDESGLFESLGIDWKMLVLQAIAFLVLLALLSKFVFPILMKMVDEREAKIAEGQKAAEEAVKQAAQTKDEVSKLLADARKEATEIVATAKDQASQAAADSDKKAKERAERIVSAASEDIAKQIASAQKTLRNETIELVAMATEKVAGSAISKAVDEKQIADALKGAK